MMPGKVECINDNTECFHSVKKKAGHITSYIIKTAAPMIFALLLWSCENDRTFPPNSGETDLINMDIVYGDVVHYQANYLRSLQTASGAIKNTEQSNSKICPYFANFACMALLKDGAPENITAVKKYMRWYMGRLNDSQNPINRKIEIPGSIYDYYGDEEATEYTYDSVDSYAATFLMLAAEFADISEENKTWLTQYREKLTLISKAMEKCIDTDYNTLSGGYGTDDDDGLSVAFPAYNAKYLMDNCEVNRGLRAAQRLKEKNLIAADSGDFAALLHNNTSAIESQLWRGTVYNWHDGGTAAAITNWSRFYPDAASQLYPALFGVIAAAGDRSNRLYTQFNRVYPNWPKGQVYADFPWALVVYAAANINDKARVDEYIKHINSFNMRNEQKDMWYNLEAAFVILAVEKIKNPGAVPPYIPKE
jgi:hypothetical protein